MDIPYLQIDGGRAQRRKQRFAFMIEALLRSRLSAGLETGCHRPDEDVNMYLAALLCRYAEGREHWAGATIIPYESELFERVRAARECRTKYLIYRRNADHLLLSVGLFGNPWLRGAQEGSCPWTTSREESIGRGKSYYARAAVYASRLDEGRRGLDELLAKLDIGFEDYVRILETLRSESFNLRQIFTVGEWYHFCRELGIGTGQGPMAGEPGQA
ncbi:MAG: hypothetical protein R3C71_12000 [Candidatus Krumholzibacteriia bacterium]|nr:hypothetical protein [bacterium]